MAYSMRERVRRWAPAIFILFFALALALFGGPGYAAPLNVHEAVYQWSSEHPGQSVPVVIETSDPSAAKAQVAAVGGVFKQDLGIVSSIQAAVPSRSVNQLAASDNVSYISLDAPVEMADGGTSASSASITSAYPFTVKANDAWAEDVAGQGVGVAVIDTGLSPVTNPDFSSLDGTSRIVASVEVNSTSETTSDGYGHGTHIAGIVGGNGSADNGRFVGVAPSANVVNVKISDDTGASGIGDLIAGLGWVMEHKTEFNIRVVNLSLHSTVPQSYKTSPLDAAVEMLWKSGIFVVVASGNSGSGFGAMSFPPANDPFVMTVGATNDKGTAYFNDDVMASWSSSGFTQDGFFKPELVAPGVNITSDSDPSSILFQQGLAKGKVVDGSYLTLSGTSMSAGVMSGVAALVAQAHPDWSPGEIKCTLIDRSRKMPGFSNFRVPRAGDTVKANSPKCNSDFGIVPNYLLRSMPFIPMVSAVAYVLSAPNPAAAADAIGLDMTAANLVTTTPNDPTVALSIETVDWSVIKWDVIKWDSIKLDVIKWDLIKWDAIKWDLIKWDVIKWDLIKWDAIKWDSIKWDAIKWDSIKWDSIKWDSIKWDAIKWDSIKWDAIKWDSIKWDSVDFDSLSEDFADDASAPAEDDDTAAVVDSAAPTDSAVSTDSAVPTE
jgi:serine protease AprX